MPYSINGTSFSLQPEMGQWINREVVGIDGAGHPIYPAVREFELRWSLMSASEFNQVQDFYSVVGTTGTCVASLPQYGASTYAFYSYSGCTLREPSVDAYFEEHASNVLLLVTNILT
uniref:Uncharacterized protein n=1 Tax=viral metagenome TaxID=1070528 RepID=A0A6H1ZAW7_9ZZZZ